LLGATRSGGAEELLGWVFGFHPRLVSEPVIGTLGGKRPQVVWWRECSESSVRHQCSAKRRRLSQWCYNV